ncbi:peptide chain release factor class I/class II, partial [Piptocephalis cylindrospora]
VLEKDLEERFVRGSGNGGQKVNKTSNCVDLLHIPSNTRIKCHKHRSLQANRRTARRMLLDVLDREENGAISRLGQQEQKRIQRAARQRRRSKKKY